MNFIKVLIIGEAIYSISDIRGDIEAALKFFFNPKYYKVKFLDLSKYKLTVDKERSQINAIKVINLIDNFEQKIQAEGDYILYVIDHDIYIPGMNFIFALADMRKKRVVLSLYRLKRDYYGTSIVSIDKFKERVFKEVLHEFGHIFGLEHCPNPECVMSFSRTLIDVDRKLPMFCKECLRKIKTKINLDL